MLDAAIRGEVGSRTVAGWVRDWRMNASPTATTEPTSQPANPTPAPENGAPACQFCGGALDPWNLVNIYVHKWELAEIMRVLKRPEETEPCESTSSAHQPEPR